MTIGFAGAGNMAAALARGLAAHADAGPMLFTDSGSGRAAALAEELGGGHPADLAALAEASDTVILAVKPQAMGLAAEGLRGFGGTLVSVLGATTLADLEAAFPDSAVLRTMPNVAVEIGAGVICHAPASDPGAVGDAVEALGAIATLVELPEDQLDAATAVMGCAPAYLALAADALAKAGARAGLDPDLSARLVGLTAAGTGELLLRHDAVALQAAVASPGGSTEAGLDALADRDAAGAFAAAVDASLARMAGSR